MARLRACVERAAALHRRAGALIDAAQRALDAAARDVGPVPQYAEQHELAAALRAAAAEIAPGWLGAPLDAVPADTPLPSPGAPDAGAAPRPAYVRVGMAQPLDDARFPALVPLDGHLAIDADARDVRSAGLLRSLVLRLIATFPAGDLRLKVVDPSGTVFAPFRALVPVGLMSGPLTDRDGLRAALAQAERWVREPDPRYRLLLVIASLPELTENAELARLANLAAEGPASGLRLIVAGWPPPPLTAEATQRPLPMATQITLRNPHAVLGDPPGGSFGASMALNAPVYLDPDPPAETIRQVAAQVAGQVPPPGSTLAELLPAEPWQEDSSDGLAAVVGRAGDHPLTLRLNDRTPHWLVGGRSGAGKTAFLVNVLYGLSTRYGPDQLIMYLLDFKEGVSFTEFTPTERDPTWIPQARVVGVESDREYGLAVLRELDGEMARRAGRSKDAGVSRFADLRAAGRTAARIVCVIDEFQVLLQGSDRLAREAVTLLEALARRGRSYGIHLILSSQTVHGVEPLYAKRDSIFGQFPVRVALPGGGDVLDALNQAADPIELGQAVINTAGGLGGPSGAFRAHERLVSLPDPYAEPAVLATLRHRLWARRTEDRPPYIFKGYAKQHLPEHLPASPRRTAYLGRVIDVPLSLAGFALGPQPGRHLAVLGPSEVGAGVLDAAARSLARQHPPGTVTFLVVNRLAAVAPLVTGLVADLRRAGHRVETGWRPADRDTYLFGFGLDGAAGQADPGGTGNLVELLYNGPERSVHVFGWWRGLRRFTEDIGGMANREAVAGLVLLNVPVADIALLLGGIELEWRPRPNRALLHDRHSGTTEVIVPFVPDGRTGTAAGAGRRPGPEAAA